ncbi:L,D-transpeptidase [Parasedimentitalea huanghaiensis]|uniref:L,D-transpeptidase family protein n=1 Tax=Parasedimentitalea huanghaiensis TaxID=2682100 RepID=A0A6L6WA45_9RHOB|nr:L,D-transpeptidase [Zongyanglinia huanghaiensis]MVO14686.1 L,D-transpeptidase family protein [Zongyanglinia huanghaiensis]
MPNSRFTRRHALLSAVATLATPSLLRAQSSDAFPIEERPVNGAAPTKRNISAFQKQQWQDHFDTLGVGCLLADINSRALHYWSGDNETYRLFPSSVPLTEDLTKRGYSKIVRKRENPSWTPTASMRERDPTLPLRMDGGPGNPLGTRAMYLDWPAYLVHGTHDTRKIGRQSSSGCIGLYNQHVEELYELVKIGTQVLLL